MTKVRNIRTLLDIELYEISGDELGEIRATATHDRFVLREILPKYCLHGETGEIKLTEDYLQWVDSGKEKYLLFNAETTDKLLGEEISNAGLERLLKGFDFNYILQTFTKNKLKNRFLQIPPSEYLIIELSYRGGGYYDGDDFDLDVNILDKLNLYALDK